MSGPAERHLDLFLDMMSAERGAAQNTLELINAICNNMLRIWVICVRRCWPWTALGSRPI